MRKYSTSPFEKTFSIFPFEKISLVSPFFKGGKGDLKTTIKLTIALLYILISLISCAPTWNGKVVYLDNGKLVIQSESTEKINSGQKILIYHQKTITHPITGEELGMIKDDIAEIPVTWVRNKTVTAVAEDPWFDMIAIEDNAKAVRGKAKPLNGSVIEIGKITDVDIKNKTLRIALDKEISSNKENLVVIRYSDIITDPETEKPIALKVEPVATVRQIDNSLFSYEPINTVSWVEIDDIVVQRYGDMLKESVWFLDVPDDFSEKLLFRRNYLRAIRYYNSQLYKEAIVELNTFIQADPKYEDSAYLLGMCYAKLNRYDDAIKFLNDYVNQNQSDQKAFIALAYIYQKQNKLTEAIKAYEKLTEIMPKESQLWIDLGDLYQKTGDKNKADNAYKKALEIDPNNAEAKFELQR